MEWHQWLMIGCRDWALKRPSPRTQGKSIRSPGRGLSLAPLVNLMVKGDEHTTARMDLTRYAP